MKYFWIYKLGENNNIELDYLLECIYESNHIHNTPNHSIIYLCKQKNEWKFFVKPIFGEDSDLKLSDFMFSLSKVNNYISPEICYEYGLNRISETEFVAIKEKRIFESRTNFGIFYHSLVQEDKNYFMSLLMKKILDFKNTKSNFKIIYEISRTFISEEFVLPTKYFLNGFKLLKKTKGVNNYLKNSELYCENIEGEISRFDIQKTYKEYKENLSVYNSTLKAFTSLSDSDESFFEFFKNFNIPI